MIYGGLLLIFISSLMAFPIRKILLIPKGERPALFWDERSETLVLIIPIFLKILGVILCFISSSWYGAISLSAIIYIYKSLEELH